jgi:orotate phosphoribosyltransferase
MTAAVRAAAILAESGAVIRDRHVVYTSGRHGSAYVNKDAVYPHTERVRELCALLAEAARPLGAEIVCGPAMGGIILAQWTGHHLGLPAVYAEKAPEGGMALRRGYDRLVRGRRVVVVEDVVNTGGSLAEAIRAVRAAGGVVAGAVALCNRGGVTAAALDVPALAALVELPLESWTAEECPLCRRGVPVDTSVGKGREFLARGRS